MRRGHARSPQFQLEAEIELGRVDSDKEPRALVQEVRQEAAPDAVELGKMPQHLH
jgi:hypothetical protein